MKEKSRLTTFVAKHEWQLLSFVVTLISTVLAAITIFLPRPGPRRTTAWLVDHDRIPIVNSKLFPNSSLRVTTTTNVEVPGDVTVVKVFFWNMGKEAIDPSTHDVLKQFSISFDETAAQILDYKMLRVSRPGIVTVKLIPQGVDNLVLDFNVLEENDGFSCEIIYAGRPAAEVHVTGAVKGGELCDEACVLDRCEGSEAWRLLTWYVATMLVLLLTVVGVYNIAFIRVSEWRKRVIEDTKEGTRLVRRLRYYAARFFPWVFAAVIFVVVICGMFIIQVKQSARANILEAVPSSIKQ